MAGVTIDVCLAFAAMQAVEAGYHVYDVVDASGAFEVTIRISKRSHPFGKTTTVFSGVHELTDRRRPNSNSFRH